jgi:hypothetical protein
MVRLGEVPLNGFETRAHQFGARMLGPSRYVASRERMVPSSTRNVPATAFSKVDFPEPLVPMMITRNRLPAQVHAAQGTDR